MQGDGVDMIIPTLAFGCKMVQYSLSLKTIIPRWIIGWDSQKVNAQCLLKTNGFRHTFIITLKGHICVQ